MTSELFRSKSGEDVFCVEYVAGDTEGVWWPALVFCKVEGDPDPLACKAYQFFWCKRDLRLYYEETGWEEWELDSPDRIGVTFNEFDSKHKETLLWVTDEAALEWDFVDEWARADVIQGDPFEVFGAQPCDRSAYCELCDDRFPLGATCRHLYDLIEGPGAEFLEPTGPGGGQDETVEDAICRVGENCRCFVRKMGCARRLLRQLQLGLSADSFSLNVPDVLFDCEDERHQCEGRLWLRGLDEKTPKATVATIRWLQQIVAQQDERRAAPGCKGYVIVRDKKLVASKLNWPSARTTVKRLRAQEMAMSRVEVVHRRGDIPAQKALAAGSFKIRWRGEQRYGSPGVRYRTCGTASPTCKTP